MVTSQLQRKQIQIAGRVINEKSPAFIVAEAGCNHMCEMDLAYKMIDAVKAAGADAIKFQTYKAEKLVISGVMSYWRHSGAPVSQLDYYRSLDRFGRKEYEALKRYADDRGVILFSTPFDLENASLLNELGMPAFKIASCDLPDTRLLQRVASFEKPVILSTGASKMEEIERAVETLLQSGCDQIVLLACTLSYPAPAGEAHLSRVSTLKEKFPDLLIGVSDHTEPDPQMMIPALAVAAGAKVVEKHFTLDRSMTGSGHSFSLSPADLKAMVQNIRFAEKVLGDPEIRLHDCELAALEKARRSLVAERPIRQGEVLTSEMIGIKRPGTGLSASLIGQVIGKKSRVDIPADAFIRLDQLEENENQR